MSTDSDMGLKRPRSPETTASDADPPDCPARALSRRKHNPKATVGIVPTEAHRDRIDGPGTHEPIDIGQLPANPVQQLDRVPATLASGTSHPSGADATEGNHLAGRISATGYRTTAVPATSVEVVQDQADDREPARLALGPSQEHRLSSRSTSTVAGPSRSPLQRSADLPMAAQTPTAAFKHVVVPAAAFTQPVHQTHSCPSPELPCPIPQPQGLLNPGYSGVPNQAHVVLPPGNSICEIPYCHHRPCTRPPQVLPEAPQEATPFVTAGRSSAGHWGTPNQTHGVLRPWKSICEIPYCKHRPCPRPPQVLPEPPQQSAPFETARRSSAQHAGVNRIRRTTQSHHGDSPHTVQREPVISQSACANLDFLVSGCLDPDGRGQPAMLKSTLKSGHPAAPIPVIPRDPPDGPLLGMSDGISTAESVATVDPPSRESSRTPAPAGLNSGDQPLEHPRPGFRVEDVRGGCGHRWNATTKGETSPITQKSTVKAQSNETGSAHLNRQNEALRADDHRGFPAVNPEHVAHARRAPGYAANLGAQSGFPAGIQSQSTLATEANSPAVSGPAEKIQYLLRRPLPTRHPDWNPTANSKSWENAVRQTFELFILRSVDKGTLRPHGTDETAMRDQFMNFMADGFLKLDRHHPHTLEILVRAVPMNFCTPWRIHYTHYFK